jgi:mannose-6-phosphate isomerase
MNDMDKQCDQTRPYRLGTLIQHYDWGGKDDRAFIAHLVGKEAEAGVAYAELWMGTHPSAPSRVLDPQNGASNLAQWIAIDPVQRLGKVPADKHKDQLPYLFKVLSAEAALSIQAHPDLKQAQQLHTEDPQHYPDSNHKPEIAIALDYLDALVGFISESELAKTLQRFPSLRNLMTTTEGAPVQIESGVKRILTLSQSDPGRISGCIEEIFSQINKSEDLSESDQLFLGEYDTYGPEDVGLLFLLLLKRVMLGPGEAVFLAPGVPHAYLKGNIIECMANSDNVVRLGLTPKYCDAKALSLILDYSSGIDYRVKTSSDGFLTEYLTPTDEFLVKSLSLLQGESRAFSYRSGLTMFLVVEGEIALKWGSEKQACTCIYRRGNAFITPAALKAFTLHAKGHSKLFLVDIPA